MKNQEFIKLLEELRKENILLSADQIRKIEGFYDEEINLLTALNKSEYLPTVIDIISTRNIDYVSLKKIIKYIDNAKGMSNVFEVAHLLMNDKVVENMHPDKLVSLVRILIESKSNCAIETRLAAEECAGKISEVTTLSIARYISRANSNEQARLALEFIKNEKIPATTKLALVIPITTAKNKDSALFAVKAVIDTAIVKSSKAGQFAEIIAGTNDATKAMIAQAYVDFCDRYEGGCIDDYINYEGVVEVVKNIISAKSAKRADYAALVAKDKDVIAEDKEVALSKSVAHARSDVRAKYAYEVAVALAEKDEAEVITKIVAQASGDKQAKVAANFAIYSDVKPTDVPFLRMVTKMEDIKHDELGAFQKNKEAAVAFFNNSQGMNDDIANAIIDVLYDPEVYVKFIDFYTVSPKEAIEALKEVSKTFNQEFDTTMTYVKKIEKPSNN